MGRRGRTAVAVAVLLGAGLLGAGCGTGSDAPDAAPASASSSASSPGGAAEPPDARDDNGDGGASGEDGGEDDVTGDAGAVRTAGPPAPADLDGLPQGEAAVTAVDHLQAVASGDAAASWALLTPEAQELSGGESAWAGVVAAAVEPTTELLAGDTTVAARPAGGQAQVVTVWGTRPVEGAGGVVTDDAVAVALVVRPVDGVLRVDDATGAGLPPARWENPQLVPGAGRGAYDPAQPLSVLLPLGAQQVTVSVDNGQALAGALAGEEEGLARHEAIALALGGGAHAATASWFDPQRQVWRAVPVPFTTG